LKLLGVERRKDGVGWADCWRGEASGEPDDNEERSEEDPEWIE